MRTDHTTEGAIDPTPSPAADHAARCEHCGKPSALNELDLCPTCASNPGVVCLYTTTGRRGIRPERWLDNLKLLAWRAARRLPLFGGGGAGGG